MWIIRTVCITYFCRFSDASFDQWVHTGRKIIISHCTPDSLVARYKLRDPNVSLCWDWSAIAITCCSNCHKWNTFLLSCLFNVSSLCPTCRCTASRGTCVAGWCSYLTPATRRSGCWRTSSCSSTLKSPSRPSSLLAYDYLCWNFKRTNTTIAHYLKA